MQVYKSWIFWACVTLAVVPATAAAFIDPGSGEIVVQHTQKCLDIDSNVGDANGARAQQWDCHGGPNQQFNRVPAGDGSYFLIVQHTQKCLDIDSNGGNANGALAQQWTCHFGGNQKFFVAP